MTTTTRTLCILAVPFLYACGMVALIVDIYSSRSVLVAAGILMIWASSALFLRLLVTTPPQSCEDC